MSRILIVDDDPDFVEILRLILEGQGYDVGTASTVDLALQSMAERIPDIVLLDMMISFVLDGYTAARHMQANPDLQRTGVLVVSSLTEAQCAEIYLATPPSNIAGWIAKPIQPAELLQSVATLLDQLRET